jgi:hypothetical protein
MCPAMDSSWWDKEFGSQTAPEPLTKVFTVKWPGSFRIICVCTEIESCVLDSRPKLLGFPMSGPPTGPCTPDKETR